MKLKITFQHPATMERLHDYESPVDLTQEQVDTLWRRAAEMWEGEVESELWTQPDTPDRAELILWMQRARIPSVYEGKYVKELGDVIGVRL